jgi:hypothetical protein
MASRPSELGLAKGTFSVAGSLLIGATYGWLVNSAMNYMNLKLLQTSWVQYLPEIDLVVGAAALVLPPWLAATSQLNRIGSEVGFELLYPVFIVGAFLQLSQMSSVLKSISEEIGESAIPS